MDTQQVGCLLLSLLAVLVYKYKYWRNSGAQAPKNVSGKNLTPTANCIVFVSQLLHKVQKLQESADALVSDLKEGGKASYTSSLRPYTLVV